MKFMSVHQRMEVLLVPGLLFTMMTAVMSCNKKISLGKLQQSGYYLSTNFDLVQEF